ncbi:hypothetical protein MMC24_006164 [Lignoscripta atroalba]|nr:hypothetical protein [Lignoscripta atroalba]
MPHQRVRSFTPEADERVSLGGSPSFLYTMIPVAIQSRISNLPSLRRSISAYSIRPTPPIYSPRWLGPQSHELPVCASLLDSSRPSSADSTPSAALCPQMRESETGTDWKYANQGLSLLETAVAEARYPLQTDNNRAFSRQLYIHALTYLLRGLPSELSEEEATSLRTAIPPTLNLPYRAPTNNCCSAPSASKTPSNPSLLHRVLASGIVHLFLLLSFLLPYIKLLLRTAYHYERTHHICEKILSSSIDAADQVGKRSFSIMESVLRAGNGKLGESLAGMLAWWVEGISGGVHEGIGAGMAIVGRRERETLEVGGPKGW